jgi:hypothetical protein
MAIKYCKINMAEHHHFTRKQRKIQTADLSLFACYLMMLSVARLHSIKFMNDNLERMWKEGVMVLIDILAPSPFAWEKLRKAMTNSYRINNIPAEIQTEHFTIMS